MDRLFAHPPRWIGFGDLLSSGASPSRLEQYRLERLLELRAVIDSLRSQDSPASGRVATDMARNLQS